MRPTDNHLYDTLLCPRAQDDATFLELPRGRDVSYRDAIAEAAIVAARLVAAGVAPGDRVLVQVAKSPMSLTLYLATVMAGAVFLPLNPAYTPVEVTYFVQDATPRLIICDTAAESALSAIATGSGARLVTLTPDGTLTLPAGDTPLAPVPRAPDDIAAILYTSGTTGRSKGAMLSHDNLVSNARILADHWHFTGDDRLIHVLPVFHTHGLFVATNVALVSGCTLIYHDRFDPEETLNALPRATAMMGVPTHYTRLLTDDRLNRETTANMRLFVSGSAPLLPETHDRFADRTGHRILERYGMTETNMITSNPYDGDRIAGTVGMPLPGIDLRIADRETGKAVATGEIGVIELRGPNVFKGYWQMPDKTAAEFRPDGYFITGDLAVQDAKGRVSIVGRAKDLIISGGFNVYPREVEEKIDTLAGVRESAVIGVPHPDLGEGIVAVIVSDGPAVNPERLLADLHPHLARYKQPKLVIEIPELPRNALGKVQKNILRDRFTGVFAKM